MANSGYEHARTFGRLPKSLKNQPEIDEKIFMYLKIHDTPQGRIVAACDEELIGRVLEEKDTCLDLDRYRGFYIGVKSGKKELKAALAKFSSANLVGTGPVGVAIAMGLINKKDVNYINNAPYIQIYQL